MSDLVEGKQEVVRSPLDNRTSEQEVAKEETISFADFLESQHPSKERKIKDKLDYDQSCRSYYIGVPPIQLYCDSESCGGTRYFDCTDDKLHVSSDRYSLAFLTFRCRHCRSTTKTYAIAAHGQKSAIKVGEWPVFGPHLSNKVRALIGKDQDFFNKGMRAETQGMGIGAFGYYRRVVENQKDRLIDEIIKVSKRLNLPVDIIANLEKAKKETQFSSAVDIIKDGIPESLKIDGYHNPLTLLHAALSEGLHAQSDEECLELATSIREVLTEFSERISAALKEEARLKQAVSKLLQIKRNQK